uniref:Uncharacterized protein n=1 Tax=Sphaerodactylus townsendi TaxID=933632 RepID=A0ACB8G9N5_9SAUR
MLNLLLVCCFGQECFAGGKAAVDGQKEPIAWEFWAFISTVVLVLLAIGTKHLCGMPNEVKQQVLLSSSEELENRLQQAFTEMEQDLVKLMTSVRSCKASLAMHHRGCKTSDCRQARESGKAFNLTVYDIVEG